MISNVYSLHKISTNVYVKSYDFQVVLIAVVVRGKDDKKMTLSPSTKTSWEPNYFLLVVDLDPVYTSFVAVQ